MVVAYVLSTTGSGGFAGVAPGAVEAPGADSFGGAPGVPGIPPRGAGVVSVPACAAAGEGCAGLAVLCVGGAGAGAVAGGAGEVPGDPGGACASGVCATVDARVAQNVSPANAAANER